MNQVSGTLSDVAHVIELAVAPVFLLTAIGTFLNVLSQRLARIVDRARVLGPLIGEVDGATEANMRGELKLLSQRRHLVNFAITFGTTAALLVCILIALAFTSAMLGWNASIAIAILFVLAMFAIIGALMLFLREIVIAARSTRMDPFEPPPRSG